MSPPQSQTQPLLVLCRLPVSLSAAGTVRGMTEPLAPLEVCRDLHTDIDRAGYNGHVKMSLPRPHDPSHSLPPATLPLFPTLPRPKGPRGSMTKEPAGECWQEMLPGRQKSDWGRSQGPEKSGTAEADARVGLLGGEVGERGGRWWESIGGGKMPSSAHLSPRSCEDSYEQWAWLCCWCHKCPGGQMEALLALRSGKF